MEDVKLFCLPGGTMDNIIVEYDLTKVKGRFYLAPANGVTNNGVQEISGRGVVNYYHHGEKMCFEIHNEVEVIKTNLLEVQKPSINYEYKKNQLAIEIANTRHFYLNNGIGRIDAEADSIVYENGIIKFKHVLKVPSETITKELKIICLPVIIGGQVSEPCIKRVGEKSE